jgi:hypothetical protein
MPRLKLRERENCGEARSVKEDELKGTRSERLLELSRERARKQTLDQFKNTRTCMLALELCLLVRTHRAVLEKQDVQDCCSFISKLCKEAGCVEASELCAKAAEAVLGSEETYLELCGQSIQKCSESRQPNRKLAERAIYVA